MEEQEVGTEHLHEIIHEHAGHASWAEKVALTTALFAVFAAISSLLSTHASDHAILLKVEASDQWNYYQAKGIKSMLTKDPSEVTRYKEEQEKIREGAEQHETQSEHYVRVHEFFSYAVTALQVATAIGAIGVLVKKRYLWGVSLGLGAIGVGLLIRAFLIWA